MKAGCDKGHIPLNETRRCQKNGYTCSLMDGENCCSTRKIETRDCIPCDETRHKKPSGTTYTTPGSCDYEEGTFYMTKIYQFSSPSFG